jgi:hypothetical protein
MLGISAKVFSLQTQSPNFMDKGCIIDASHYISVLCNCRALPNTGKKFDVLFLFMPKYEQVIPTVTHWNTCHGE